MRGNFSRVLWAARGRAEHISVVSVSHRKRVMLSEASAPRVWRCEIVWRAAAMHRHVHAWSRFGRVVGRRAGRAVASKSNF